MKQEARFAALGAGLLLGVAAWVSAGDGPAQSPPLRDPQAVAVVSEALKALDGQTTINDVVLEGNVAFTAGSDQESGPATLIARGSQESRVTLNLDGGQRQEIRRGQSGAWIGPDGQAHPIATHNTWTDAVWFFPALALEAVLSDPQLGLVYVAKEARDSLTVHHLRVSRLLPGQDAQTTAWIERLSAVDIFIDSGSSFPVALAFAAHPDNNGAIDIPVEIRFSDYRVVEGVKVPLRVQKLLQGSVLLDLSMSAVHLNSGVPESEFNLPGGQP